MTMSINSVNNVSSNTYTTTAQTAAKTNSKSETAAQKNTASEAATYEKTSKKETSKTKDNSAIVAQMKSDLENRQSQLRSLVEKMMTKQGQAYNQSTDMFSLLREGKLTVDPETAAQAKRDIAEDGYWGVEQTSDRLVSFAQALSGGDTSKADELMKAMQKGFNQAGRAWGGKLPDICQKTMDTALEKMEKWKNGAEEEA